ncbi:MAG TPA: zinc-dependent peptidase [Burkholderiaceae bacterium]|nr:zinc-dependent peptidase [Burkholderiaceae bacterium]
MLKGLIGRFARTPASIPDELWKSTLRAVPFLARLNGDERARLRSLAERLLTEKEMAGAAGLELTAEMQVHIAAQASLPILNLGFEWYRGWSSIVVYPNEFLVPRSVTDDAGVVHEYTEPISGEAWDGGPLLLSWEDAQLSNATDGAAYSVVIHEFTHKIDLLNGDADGIPPFAPALHPNIGAAIWQATLQDAHETFIAELELVESELPADVDPDSGDADRYYAHLPLDPYAAQDAGEFFAVSSETFFVEPARLQAAFPRWYALLAKFFRQDPLAP